MTTALSLCASACSDGETGNANGGDAGDAGADSAAGGADAADGALDSSADVAVDAAIACGASVPVQTSPPSCQSGGEGQGSDCGASGDADCCDSPLVECGRFNRNNDPAQPAGVSDFRLDTYLITVGRFRAFVEAGMGTRDNPPAAGAGSQPRIEGSGWDPAFNERLISDDDAGSALASAVQCSPEYQTWDAGDDHLPMNCITWYEAFAFCIWDGGRLPTDLEYNYAAAGGDEQRKYPWGDSDPGPDAELAVYGCYYGTAEPGTCDGIQSLAPVGAIPAGNARWGHADLAGELWEWVLDWYEDYTGPCFDCANLENSYVRASRGGSLTSVAESLACSYRTYDDPSTRSYTRGARCARDFL